MPRFFCTLSTSNSGHEGLLMPTPVASYMIRRKVLKLLGAAIGGQEELWLLSHAPGREPSRIGATATVIAQQRWWLLGIVDHLWTSHVRILSLPSCLGCDRLWLEEMCRVLAWARRSALEWLDLSGCLLGDSGFAQLAEALRTNTTVTTLYLWDNQIGDAGISALAGAIASGSLGNLAVLDSISRSWIGEPRRESDRRSWILA